MGEQDPDKKDLRVELRVEPPEWVWPSTLPAPLRVPARAPESADEKARRVDAISRALAAMLAAAPSTPAPAGILRQEYLRDYADMVQEFTLDRAWAQPMGLPPAQLFTKALSASAGVSRAKDWTAEAVWERELREKVLARWDELEGRVIA